MTDQASSSRIFNPSPHSSPHGGLRTGRNLQHHELQREQQRRRSLQGSLNNEKENIRQLRSNNRRLKAELNSLKTEPSNLKTNLSEAEKAPLAMIQIHMYVWGLENGLQFQKVPDSLPQLLDQLLKCYVANKKLREEAEALKIDAQANKDEAHTARKAELDGKLRAKASQEQVHALQQQLLAQVDNESAVTDDKLFKDFRCLVALIKSLSHSIHITKDTNMLGILGIGCLLRDVDNKHWNSRARKKALAEAWIWSVLWDKFFASLFALSDENGVMMTQLWHMLFGTGHDHGWPIPSAVCEKWRYTTAEHLVHISGLDYLKDNDEGGDSAMHDNDFDSLFHEERVGDPVRNEAISIISSRLATVSTKGDFAQIPGIVDRAMTLALEMSLQRCRLQITYSAVNTNFVESQMCAIVDTDGEEMQDEVVAFVVHPGLTKWGDANGKDLDQRYDIVPSLVQLQPLKLCAPE